MPVAGHNLKKYKSRDLKQPHGIISLGNANSITRLAEFIMNINMQERCNRAEQEKGTARTLVLLNLGCQIQYTLFTGTADQSCNQENKGVAYKEEQ